MEREREKCMCQRSDRRLVGKDRRTTGACQEAAGIAWSDE